jgi:hypothetical protein
MTVRWLFLRLLGSVFLIAFLSLWSQVDGLIGSDGILPAADYMAQIEARDDLPWWRVPTLCRLSASDGFLHVLCAAGVVLSLALIVGAAQIPVLFLLWTVYLSLLVAGQAFLSFQWDILLLEVAFTSMLFAPTRLRPCWPASEGPVPRPGLWALRLLLFKLMVLSGVVKLIVLDETWWGLTALDYHYFTQPLPTWTSWYAHHLPGWFQKASVFLMFVIEIPVPFLMFFGRRMRLVVFVALVSLQLLIALTGNYTFFNLLTIVLCITLLDSRRPTSGPARAAGSRLRPRRLGRAVRAVLASFLLLVSGLTFLREMSRTVPPAGVDSTAGQMLKRADRALLRWGQPYILDWTGPFRTINGYGLFRGMTTARPEIVIEGSDDGRAWKEYEFKWKPGDPARAPGFVQPHQPRLDWQMWFAALNPRRAYWLDGLIVRLLEGSPAVLDLLGPNPFPDASPRKVRLAYYRYEFTTPGERRRSGTWWTRRREGFLTRPLALDDFRAGRAGP